ncbi:MAG: hypothetical protein HY888_11960, partial [Deltaproteobacteria bacterium]|nr:hypothetical protein [Deltaproteobacteria bacterium]
MKHQGNPKRIICVLACVACLQSAQSFAVTTVVQKKEMVIDSNWKTKGRYESEFLVETPQGAKDMKLYLDHLSAQPDKFRQLVIRVRLPGKRQQHWNPANTGLPVGSTVHVDYSVSAMFPGFEGLFADYFSIDQLRPVTQASYLVRFP